MSVMLALFLAPLDDEPDDVLLLSSLPHAATANDAAASTAASPRRQRAFDVPLMWTGPPPALWDWSSLQLGPAAQLIEVDGADEHGADSHLLPERLDADD